MPLGGEDETYLRRAIEVARQGIKPENGSNRPYGALIRFTDGRTMEAWNTVARKGDATRHAKMTLLSKVFDSGMHWKEDRDKLREATIYTSAEPLRGLFSGRGLGGLCMRSRQSRWMKSTRSISPIRATHNYPLRQWAPWPQPESKSKGPIWLMSRPLSCVAPLKIS